VARQYSRDSRGRFGSKNSKGDRAETVQQNKAKKDKERRSKKNELSGGKVGPGKRRRTSRQGSVGSKATTKAARNSTARARRRFG
jgi:hypothetical protein